MKKVFFRSFDNAKGGVKTFMNNLKASLDKAGYPYTNNPDDNFTVVLCVIMDDLEFLKKAKKRGARVVQRLDGVYYFSKHGIKYKRYNSEINKIYSSIADYIVFQSEYSRRQCEKVLGSVRVPSRVVLNGVDKDIFRPTMEKRKPGDETRFITTGNFRDKDMLVPVFDAMDLLVKEYPLRLEVAGFVKEELKPLLNRSYIDYIGDVDAGVVAERLARADAFIYSFLNPPCPNSVLEAVSAGIPVVSFDNGAMLEILRFNRDLLAQTNIRVIQRHRDLSSASLADKARCLIKDYPRYRLISQNNAYRYSVEEMMKQYLEVFENA